MITNEDLFQQFKVVTGWTSHRINEKVSELKCSYFEALDFFKNKGRLPTCLEQNIINEFGLLALLNLLSFNEKVDKTIPLPPKASPVSRG
jgi:hypothetical protein